jgi:AraC family chitin signaling transcriptional activator
MSCLAYRLLLELHRASRPLHPESVKKAIAFVQANLHRHVSRLEICEHIGMSSAAFSRLFTSCVGCSPMKYFLNQKFNWTAHLLKKTPLSIKEIGYQAGFEDPLYFSAQFKKHFGMSPLNYRQTEAPEIRLETNGVFAVSRERDE